MLAADDAEVAILGRCLERRSLRAHIDTLLYLDVVLLGNFEGLGNKPMRIGLAHVGETHAQLVVVAAVQRMFGEEVDVVADNHDVADGKVGVHAAGRIGDKEVLDTQLLHHPHGESHLLHVISLIEMETALHSHHIFFTELPEDKFSLMPLDSRHGEIGDFGIGNFGLVGNMVYQLAQPRTQYDSGLGQYLHSRSNVGSGFFNLFNHRVTILVNNKVCKYSERREQWQIENIVFNF